MKVIRAAIRLWFAAHSVVILLQFRILLFR